MNNRGTFKIARALLDHPVLDSGPFDRRSAWTWLLSEASWAARIKTVGNVSVQLERSELAVSVRYLAKRWKWDASKVQRFLDRLATEKMIERRICRNAEKPADPGLSVIRVVNFDRWQGAGNRYTPDTSNDMPTDTPPEAESNGNATTSSINAPVPDTPPDTVGDRKRIQIHKQHKEKKVIALFPGKTAAAPQRQAWPPDAFDQWYRIYPRKKAPKKARDAFTKLNASDEIGFDELLAATRRFAAEVASWPADRKQYIPYPASWLNAGSYAEEPDTSEDSRVPAPTRDAKNFTDCEWTERLQQYQASGDWSGLWGPRPGEIGCLAPDHLQAKFRRGMSGGHYG